jgi:Tfp pilus assembly protein PilO
MNKKISLGKFSTANLSSIKLLKGITITHLVLIAVGVILLALTIYFAVSYFSAEGNKKDLNQQIQQKQQQINSMSGPENISALLSQLESALEDLTEQSPFPEVANNTDVAYSIIQAAREASITCFSYNPGEPDTYNINDNGYIQNTYSISVQASSSTTGEKITKINNFLEELESAYDTAMVTGVSLSDGDGDGLWTIDFTYSVISLTITQ